MQVPTFVSWRKKSKNNLLQTVTVAIVLASAMVKNRPQYLCVSVIVVPGVVIAAMAAVLPKGICNF